MDRAPDGLIGFDEGLQMILGWVIGINLLSFLFLAEANLLGKTIKKIPGFVAIAQLRLVRETRAFRLYVLLLAVFAMIAMYPGKQLALFFITPNMLVVVWMVQIIIWSVLLAVNHVRCGFRL